MVVALTAGWSASAAALPPLPPPPITLPTVTLPTVTVPPVTVPPVTTPAATTPAVTTPTVTLPSQGPPRAPDIAPQPAPHTSKGSQPAGQPTTENSRVGRAETSREHASRLRLARDWISYGGPQRQRRTTLFFVLRRAALVELVLRQVAPDCRRVGRLRVRGHRGVNRLRLRTRIGRHALAPGTYTVVVRALPSGRTIGHARLIVVHRASEREIRAARGADSCRARADANPASELTQPPAGALGLSPEQKRAQPTRHRGVLGARFAKVAFSAADEVPLWVYLLLALAIALLGAAAFLPRTEPAGFPARLVLGVVGVAILVGFTIAELL
jgi:hypothetical protein